MVKEGKYDPLLCSMYRVYQEGFYKRLDPEVRFKNPKYLDVVTRKAWYELDYNKLIEKS